MRSNHVAAFLAALALFTLVAASCVQGSETSSGAAPSQAVCEGTTSGPSPEEEGDIGEARQEATFSPSVFHFSVVVPDDHKDEAGGWQRAPARLHFGDWRHPWSPKFWACSLGVEMPLRTKVNGRISAASAAQMAATIATDASSEVMHSRPEWLGEDFCIAFRARMKQMFASRYPTIGARVTPR